MNACKILPASGSYEIQTPYLRGFVADLKAMIPASERVYNKDRYTWTVSEWHGDLIVRLIERWYDETVTLPTLQTSAILLGILEVLYIGRTKQRGTGDASAFGWTRDGSWGLIFPETVLKSYFDPNYVEEQKSDRPAAAATTYYETLGIKNGVDLNAIKAGYRRMVKQWHPDVCKEPDAAEVFRQVQHAFEILSDPKSKARYDVGLKLEKKAKLTTPARKVHKDEDYVSYRSPLKCGNLLCQYTELGSRKTIQKILQWEDIYNAAGQVLTSSWIMGDKEPTLIWS